MLTVTVTDKEGRPLANLTHDAFTVRDDKEPQKIAFFLSQDDPVSIGILFDVSGSMLETGMVNEFRKNLLRFIQQSHHTNEYFLIGFNKSVQLLTDWTSGRDVLIDGLNKITQLKGATALFDALYTGIEKVKQGKHSKHVLLLISDGQDNSSDHKLEEARRLLKESDVIVYTLGIVDPLLDPLSRYGHVVLAELASLSGGVAFFPPEPKAASEAFNRLALELRHQYLIGFYPTNMKRDGKWHKVKVEIKPLETKDATKPNEPPKIISPKVRTRAGYYARRN